MTVEQVLADPVISHPLTRIVWSSIGDGAAALVLASRAAARRLGITDPVTIRASVLRSGSDPESGDPAGYRTARAAYEEGRHRAR